MKKEKSEVESEVDRPLWHQHPILTAIHCYLHSIYVEKSNVPRFVIF